MMRFLLRFVINAIAIAVITSGVLPGIAIIGNSLPTIAVVALIFGLVNSLIKPIVRVLTCPFVLLTLGLFTFVINGAMLYLASALAGKLVDLTHGSLHIENFAWAIVGALIVSVIDVILEAILTRVSAPEIIVIRGNTPTSSTARGEDDLFDNYDPNTGKFKR